jgi:hypothetical protein
MASHFFTQYGKKLSLKRLVWDLNSGCQPPLFLESVNTEEQGHNAEWLSQDLSCVIKDIGDNVVGAVTDNTATNKKCGAFWNSNTLHTFFMVVSLMGFIFLSKISFVKEKKTPPRGGPAAYPDDYPFEELLIFAQDCKEVVTFSHNHHVVKEKLKKELASAKLSGRSN